MIAQPVSPGPAARYQPLIPSSILSIHFKPSPVKSDPDPVRKLVPASSPVEEAALVAPAVVFYQVYSPVPDPIDSEPLIKRAAGKAS